MGRLSRIVDRAVNRTARPGQLPASERARRLVVTAPVADLLVGTPLFRDFDPQAELDCGINLVGLTVATTWPDLRGSWSRWHFRSLGLPPGDVDSPLAIAEWQIDRIRTRAAKSNGRMLVIESAGDVDGCAQVGGPLGVLIGVQGGHVLEGDPANVGRLRALGVRMLAPAHVMDNALVGSATGRRRDGLSALGREVLAELERERVVVDLAHMSEAGIADSLSVLAEPPIISHTALRDDTLRASRWRRYSAATRSVAPELAGEVAGRGGLVGIVLATELLGGESLGNVAVMVRRTLEVCGPQAIALGSDLDGALKMVIGHAGLPALVDEMLDGGIEPGVVRDFMGGNALRFLGTALGRG